MSFWEWAVYVTSLRCQIFAGRDRVHDVRRGPRRRARPPPSRREVSCVAKY
jgi:hypothetical protein